MATIQSTKSNKNFSAWGLVEILISMAIYAVAIVSITSLNAKNYYKIRENELADRSNKLLISAVEYFKSPAQDVQIRYLNPIPVAGHFSYVLDSTSREIKLITAGNEVEAFVWEPKSDVGYRAKLASCDTNSATRVTYMLTDTQADPFLTCLRVDIDRKENGYKISAWMRYLRGGEWVDTNIIGYRPFTYVDQP